jgi:hypothetical protein
MIKILALSGAAFAAAPLAAIYVAPELFFDKEMRHPFYDREYQC